MAKLRRVHGDALLNQAQNNVAEILEPLSRVKISQGLLIQNVDLSAGDNLVNHMLDRNLIGWFIVRQRGPASIYDKQDTNPNSAVTIALTSSAGVTIDLWVF